MNNDLINQWIKKADADLDTVNSLLKTDYTHYEIVCFHCQQAVEKYFKAFLINSSIRILKTNDLEVLLNMCINEDNSFEKFDRILLSGLTDFAVLSRYPDDFIKVTKDEAIRYQEMAVNIRSFITKKIEEKK